MDELLNDMPVTDLGVEYVEIEADADEHCELDAQPVWTEAFSSLDAFEDVTDPRDLESLAFGATIGAIGLDGPGRRTSEQEIEPAKQLDENDDADSLRDLEDAGEHRRMTEDGGDDEDVPTR